MNRIELASLATEIYHADRDEDGPRRFVASLNPQTVATDDLRTAINMALEQAERKHDRSWVRYDYHRWLSAHSAYIRRCHAAMRKQEAT